jgi:hypothetical protein
MSNWAGTRDYSSSVEYFRKDSTEELLEDVKCDIYCITTMFAGKTIEERFNWIVVWNSYITLKANLDVIAERSIDSYPTKLAAEAMLARLENALGKRRAEGQETRLLRRKLKASKHISRSMNIVERLVAENLQSITSIELANASDINHHKMYRWLRNNRQHFESVGGELQIVGNFIILNEQQAMLAIVRLPSLKGTKKAWQLSDEAENIMLSSIKSRRGKLN